MRIITKIERLLKNKEITLKEFCIKNELSYQQVCENLKENNFSLEFLLSLYDMFPDMKLGELLGEISGPSSDVERLDMLFDYLKLSRNALGKTIGDKNGMRFQNIYGKRNKISMSLARSITEAFPKISYKWLLTGVGEMLKEQPSEQVIVAKVKRMEEQYEILQKDFQALMKDVILIKKKNLKLIKL